MTNDANLLTMLFALVFVLALMGLLFFTLKRLGLAGPALPIAGSARRLGVVEVLALSAQHRAVLLKRDQVEHLVILGPTGDVVVESNIQNKGEIS